MFCVFTFFAIFVYFRRNFSTNISHGREFVVANAQTPANKPNVAIIDSTSKNISMLETIQFYGGSIHSPGTVYNLFIFLLFISRISHFV